MCSLDNVRRFWLCIRGRKKFVPSVHAGVPGSDRGSHRRGTCQAEGAREEESGRRGKNAAVFPSAYFIYVESRASIRKDRCWLETRILSFFFCLFFNIFYIFNYQTIYTILKFQFYFHVWRFNRRTIFTSVSHPMTFLYSPFFFYWEIRMIYWLLQLNMR